MLILRNDISNSNYTIIIKLYTINYNSKQEERQNDAFIFSVKSLEEGTIDHTCHPRLRL